MKDEVLAFGCLSTTHFTNVYSSIYDEIQDLMNKPRKAATKLLDEKTCLKSPSHSPGVTPPNDFTSSICKYLKMIHLALIPTFLLFTVKVT